MLESRRCELLVLFHEGLNVVEITIEKASHDSVLVVVDLVTVEALVLVDQPFKILSKAVICIDGESSCTKPFKIVLIQVWELFRELSNQSGETKLRVHLDQPRVDGDRIREVG